MLNKKYVAKVVAIDVFGDAIIELPDDLIKELNWQIGDTLDYKLENKSVVITNISKNQRSL